jgi:hypothetical protein
MCPIFVGPEFLWMQFLFKIKVCLHVHTSGFGLNFGYLRLRSGITMKVTQDPITWDILGGTNGFTRWRVKFKWSTTPSSLSSNDYSHLKTSSPPSLINTLCCETWKTYMEPPRNLDGIQGWLVSLNKMISSKSSTINVICNKCIIPNCSHFPWHGMVYSNI